MHSPTAFDHIAFALPRIADAVPFLVGVLGGVPYSGAQGGPEFRFGTWRYANGGDYGSERGGLDRLSAFG